MPNYTCLIQTHTDNLGELLLPHLDVLKRTNPDVEIHIVVSEDHPLGRDFRWRNGDLALREWWINNNHLVSNDNIAVMEWDTLVNCPLPEIPRQFDVAAANIYTEPKNLRGKWQRKYMAHPRWSQDNWWWWKEIPRLELKNNQTARGLVSFGCFFTKRWVLDAISKPEWDHLYEKDIISELRFPTIAGIEGAKLGEIPLPHVHFNSTLFTNEEAIYHAIKHKVL